MAACLAPEDMSRKPQTCLNLCIYFFPAEVDNVFMGLTHIGCMCPCSVVLSLLRFFFHRFYRKICLNTSENKNKLEEAMDLVCMAGDSALGTHIVKCRFDVSLTCARAGFESAARLLRAAFCLSYSMVSRKGVIAWAQVSPVVGVFCEVNYKNISILPSLEGVAMALPAHFSANDCTGGRSSYVQCTGFILGLGSLRYT